MPEAASVLTPWSNFYVIAGSSAAALTGLMFVVITLVVASERREGASEGTAGFSTPTVAYFGAGLLVSAIMSAPWRSLLHVGIVVGIVGLCGVVYVGTVTLRMRRQTIYEPDGEDWLWYSLAPMLALAAVLAGGALLTIVPIEAMFVLGAATLTLIFIGIRNAWDIVTYIAIDLRAADRSDDGPA